MRIALADDHALFRAGLRSTLIEAFGPRVEVAEAESFDELTKLLAGEGKFDLVLCDTAVPGIELQNGVQELVSLCLDAPLVMVSSREEPAEACTAIDQGARGFIQKSESLAVLKHAIELVLAGGVYVPALVLLRQKDPARGRPPSSTLSPAAKAARLSDRQWMIFERLAEGAPNKLIARELGIAEGTVKAQVRSIFRKLGVRNRTQAALLAAEILGRPAGFSEPAQAKVRHAPANLPAPPLGPPSFHLAKGASLKIVTSRD